MQEAHLVIVAIRWRSPRLLGFFTSCEIIFQELSMFVFLFYDFLIQPSSPEESSNLVENTTPGKFKWKSNENQVLHHWCLVVRIWIIFLKWSLGISSSTLKKIHHQPTNQPTNQPALVWLSPLPGSSLKLPDRNMDRGWAEDLGLESLEMDMWRHTPGGICINM